MYVMIIDENDEPVGGLYATVDERLRENPKGHCSLLMIRILRAPYKKTTLLILFGRREAKVSKKHKGISR